MSTFKCLAATKPAIFTENENQVQLEVKSGKMFDFITIYRLFCCILQNCNLLYSNIWNNTSYLYKYVSGTYNSPIFVWMWRFIVVTGGAMAPAVCVNYQNLPQYNTLSPVLWGIYCNRINLIFNANQPTDFKVVFIFHDQSSIFSIFLSAPTKSTYRIFR